MGNRILLIFMSALFFVIAFNAYEDAKPSYKDKKVYKEIKPFIPYYLEKRFGGFSILSKNDKDFKEKPDIKDVFHRFEELEKTWGKNNLKLENNTLLIYKDKKVVKKISNLTIEDIKWLKGYFGI